MTEQNDFDAISHEITCDEYDIERIAFELKTGIYDPTKPMEERTEDWLQKSFVFHTERLEANTKLIDDATAQGLC